MDNNVKPPIGVMPKFIWERTIKQERAESLLKAMLRYFKAGYAVDEEWIKEYDELVRELRKGA